MRLEKVTSRANYRGEASCKPGERRQGKLSLSGLFLPARPRVFVLVAPYLQGGVPHITEDQSVWGHLSQEVSRYVPGWVEKVLSDGSSSWCGRAWARQITGLNAVRAGFAAAAVGRRSCWLSPSGFWFKADSSPSLFARRLYMVECTH